MTKNRRVEEKRKYALKEDIVQFAFFLGGEGGGK